MIILVQFTTQGAVLTFKYELNLLFSRFQIGIPNLIPANW